MASTFMAMVYSTLKEQGVDTSELTPKEAVEKFNELNGKENIKTEEIKNNSLKEVYSVEEIVLSANNEDHPERLEKNIKNLIYSIQLESCVAEYSVVECSKILDTSTKNAGKEDVITKNLIKSRGYNKPPQVFSKEKLDNHIKQGAVELYRGVGVDGWQDTFINGDMYVGVGANGSGIYAVKTKDNDSQSAYDTAKMYAKRKNPNFKDEHIARMSLLKDAKIIDISDLKEIQFSILEYLSKQIDVENESSKKENLSKKYYAVHNYGTLATLLGYDVVINSRSNSNYYLILNRGKVIVEHE